MISLIEELGLLGLFVLAFANGANDAGKSVVSLEMPGPSGTPIRRRPLVWGGFFTGLGSLAAIIVSGRLLQAFTPQSFLLPTPELTFVLAAVSGAALWILLGTIIRLPVSSTHAIVGGIVILGIYLYGTSQIHWSFLLVRVVLPLAGGPIVALVGIYALDRVTKKKGPQQPNPPIRSTKIVHWLTGAATAFARGINDAPKMAALGAFFLLAYPSEQTWVPYSIIAVAVLLGSLALGHRVVVTAIGPHGSLDHVQRSKANAATAIVVSAGAILGAPMSTTQVHNGSSAGIGGRKSVIKSTLRTMLLPWLVTLPGAGILAVAVFYIGTVL